LNTENISKTGKKIAAHLTANHVRNVTIPEVKPQEKVAIEDEDVELIPVSKEKEEKEGKKEGKKMMATLKPKEQVVIEDEDGELIPVSKEKEERREKKRKKMMATFFSWEWKLRMERHLKEAEFCKQQYNISLRKERDSMERLKKKPPKLRRTGSLPDDLKKKPQQEFD
jgi:maltodextrin utilization protein YvdJ